MSATVFNSIFIGLLVLALFYKAGDLSDIEEYIRRGEYEEAERQYRKAVGNWVGISFLLANNLMFPSIMVVIIQMPL